MFTEDLTAFFKTAEFAEAATFAVGTSTSSVNGIYSAPSEHALDIDGQAPSFTCVGTDVPNARGGSLTVRGHTHTIVGVDPDGQGVVRLKLQQGT